jgi:YebC/PmpR family DNA-binding regulatory protein
MLEVIVSTVESARSNGVGGSISGYHTRTFSGCSVELHSMAGHSKWANIQHRKGAQDKKRGKIFTKLIREITAAARISGGDQASNPRLRIAIDKAKAASMPRDNIDRAIKRGTGELGAENFQEIRYEGYGPGGVAVMVHCLTDNRNRTVSEIRHVFTRYGGNLGAEGSVGYLFNQVGMLCYPPGIDEDRLMEAALEAGAEDVVTNEDSSIDVLTDPNEYENVRQAMSSAGFVPGDAEVTMRASTTAPLEGEQAESMLRMLEALEDLDDVQNVYSNADLPDEILARA